MTGPAHRHHAACWLVLAAVSACTIAPYRPEPLDTSLRRPPRGSAAPTTVGATGELPPAPDEPPLPAPVPAPQGPLQLATVLRSVTERYPPLLSALLERDLASGRLTQALGGFDPNLTAKLGGQVQGYYEATTLQALLEQPLATGDTLYGGYRVSDGFLPDYDKDRTQDSGAFVVGGRIPLLRDRGFDRRRAGVLQARIDQELAEPVIERARLDFVRAAARSYHAWVAAGQRLRVAEELLALATQRVGDLTRAVERQFLAPIDVTDNERLIAQRRLFVVRAERQLQQAALELSLFWRDPEDAPIVPERSNLPDTTGEPLRPITSVTADAALALQQRPELRRLQHLLARTETELELARNQALPNLDLVVEATRSLGDATYGDIERTELFVGGELKLPLWRRDALGRVEQATAQRARLEIDSRFARDRIVTEVADARSALDAALQQLAESRRNSELAGQLVDAERRAFELGRSDLLRVQLREVQFADARVAEIEARLSAWLAAADLDAARGDDVVSGQARGD